MKASTAYTEPGHLPRRERQWMGEEHTAALGKTAVPEEQCGKPPHTRGMEVNSFCFEMNTCSRSHGNGACSLLSIPVTE